MIIPIEEDSMFKNTFGILLALIWATVNFTGEVKAEKIIEHKEFKKNFQAYQTGTFIVFDEAQNQYRVFNNKQSKKRVSPDSTFQIFISLAGLEAEILDSKDDNTFMKWDGSPQPFALWRKDQTLSSATYGSVVWYFQGIVNQIGEKKMKEFLKEIGYGNQKISGEFLTFWIQSSLTISPKEQVDILYRAYSNQLKIKPENLEILRQNITFHNKHGLRIMGQTGSNWNGENGWYVGWVEKGGNRYFFATYIAGAKSLGKADGANARIITLELLDKLGITSN